MQNQSIGQLILITGKDPVRELSGGHSSYARAHALAAVRAGYAPHIFCIGDSDETESLPYGTLHRVRTLDRFFKNRAGLARIRSAHAGVHSLYLVPAIRRWAAQTSGPMVLHGFGTWATAAVWGVRSLRRAGREAASVVNSYTVHRAEYRSKFHSLGREHPFWTRWHYGKEYVYGCTLGHILERNYLRGADCLLVNYDSVRRLIEGAHGVMPKLKKVSYASEFAFQDVPPGPDPDFDATLRNLRPEGAPLIVSVSRHDPRKGISILLHALAELRKRGTAFRACIASGGELLETHQKLAHNLSLDGQVALPGYIKDPRVCLNAADVFVLPSLEEHSGSVSLLEAMQAGRAILSSGVDGMLEDIEDGVSGRHVPPGQVQPLANTLAELLADPAQRIRLGREARRSFETRFSADALARTLDDIYRGFGLRPGGMT